MIVAQEVQILASRKKSIQCPILVVSIVSSVRTSSCATSIDQLAMSEFIYAQTTKNKAFGKLTVNSKIVVDILN